MKDHATWKLISMKFETTLNSPASSTPRRFQFFSYGDVWYFGWSLKTSSSVSDSAFASRSFCENRKAFQHGELSLINFRFDYSRVHFIIYLWMLPQHWNALEVFFSSTTQSCASYHFKPRCTVNAFKDKACWLWHKINGHDSAIVRLHSRLTGALFNLPLFASKRFAAKRESCKIKG